MDLLELVANFILYWDRGEYDITDRRALEFLQGRFPYQGWAYRGERGGMIEPEPPVSWSKTMDGLIYFWTHAGIPGRGRVREIPAYRAYVSGIDVEAMAKWYLSESERDSLIDFRAARLMSFKEVITLDVPPMDLIGTLVEDSIGAVVLFGFVP